jgi:hypothetical protein
MTSSATPRRRCVTGSRSDNPKQERAQRLRRHQRRDEPTTVPADGNRERLRQHLTEHAARGPRPAPCECRFHATAACTVYDITP